MPGLDGDLDRSLTPFGVRLLRVLSIRLASVVCPVLPLGLTSVPRCRFRPRLR